MVTDECDIEWFGPSEDDPDADERAYCMTHRQYVYLEIDGAEPTPDGMGAGEYWKHFQ